MVDAPFGDLVVGTRRRSKGRTITETDVVNFCMLTGNWLELHTNVEYAKTTPYGQRLVQGSLVFSIVNALMGFDSELIETFYGVDRLRFTKPTFINDTLYARTEITALREKGDRHGVATLRLEGVKHTDEVVMSCEFSLLVRKERLRPLA